MGLGMWIWKGWGRGGGCDGDGEFRWEVGWGGCFGGHSEFRYSVELSQVKLTWVSELVELGAWSSENVSRVWL